MAAKETKDEIIAHIHKIIEDLEKVGADYDFDINYKQIRKKELMKIRQKLLVHLENAVGLGKKKKKSGKKGGTKEGALLDENELEYVEIGNLRPPFKDRENMLSERDTLAEKIRHLLTELEYVRPGMEGYYNTAGKKGGAQVIKCPHCGAEIMAAGKKKKAGMAKNPNRKPKGKGLEWQDMLNKVGGMAEHKGKPRSEIMKIASAMRKAKA